MKTPIDFSGLTSLFDPKVEAEGAALLARTKNFESESRYNDQRAGQIGDRRAALANDSALIAAGYTPRQIAAMRTTQTDSMADLFGGVRTDTGTQMLTNGGDARQAAVLLNHSKALDADAAFNDIQAGNIRREQAASEMAKSVATAQAAAKGRAAGSRAAGVGAAAAQENLPFSIDQVNGPLRQAIVDMYHAGSKDTGDFTTLDEGMIRKIQDTAQGLLASKVSTRSSALADAFGVLGLSNSTEAAQRFDTETETTEGGWLDDDVTKVKAIKPKLQPALELDETSRRVMSGEVLPEAVGSMPIYEIPLDQINSALPSISSQAEVGTQFKIGNRLYEKVEMPDGSTHLQAIR